MATTTVYIDDPMAFTPPKANINTGDTVQWIWRGSGHSTTADDNSWDSGVQDSPFTYSHTFPTAGTYPYYCSQHGAPGGIGMAGTVVVS